MHDRSATRMQKYRANCKIVTNLDFCKKRGSFVETNSSFFIYTLVKRKFLH